MMPRGPCLCEGYHFPHRKGGGACTHSPYVEYYKARRAGYGHRKAMTFLTAGQLEQWIPDRLVSGKGTRLDDEASDPEAAALPHDPTSGIPF